MSEKTKKQKILLFVPSRPMSRNQFCRLMVGFRVDGHNYAHGITEYPSCVLLGVILSCIYPKCTFCCEWVVYAEMVIYYAFLTIIINM